MHESVDPACIHYTLPNLISLLQFSLSLSSKTVLCVGVSFVIVVRLEAANSKSYMTNRHTHIHVSQITFNTCVSYINLYVFVCVYIDKILSISMEPES